MAINQQATTKITLNNEQAKRELDELQNKMQGLIELKKKAEKEGDLKAYKQISSELTKAQREVINYQKQLESVFEPAGSSQSSCKNYTDKSRFCYC